LVDALCHKNMVLCIGPICPMNTTTAYSVSRWVRMLEPIRTHITVIRCQCIRGQCTFSFAPCRAGNSDSLANRHVMPTTAHMRRLRGSRRDPSNKESMGRDSSFVEHSALIPTRLSPATPNAVILRNRFPMLHARRSHAPSPTASPAPALRLGHGQMDSSSSGNNEWLPSPAPRMGMKSPAPHAPGRDPPTGQLP
jgi:hypothetical protein